MKTGFNLLDEIYTILVPSVNSVIDGRIYRRAKKPNSEKQDIVILTLPIIGRKDKDLQLGTIIVNIFCINLHSGTPNETKLKEITDTVTTELEAYTQSGTSYFDLEIISENTMKDTDQPNMSYTSLRVNCMIQAQA